MVMWGVLLYYGQMLNTYQVISFLALIFHKTSTIKLYLLVKKLVWWFSHNKENRKYRVN